MAIDFTDKKKTLVQYVFVLGLVFVAVIVIVPVSAFIAEKVLDLMGAFVRNIGPPRI